MTEQAWLTCTDPTPMLEFLRAKASYRKSRLFACVCCRQRIVLRAKRNRELLQAAEDFADGRIGRKEIEQARSEWQSSPCRGVWQTALYFATMPHSPLLAVEIATHAAEASEQPDRERCVQAAFLRDIFGNPFRPVTIDPAWLLWNDGTLPKIAQALYDDKAFDRMPILADALAEAGCGDEEILDHLRGPGPHVRGCWAVDLLLGKS